MTQQLPAVVPGTAGRISYQAFLDWLDDETYAEWVDGKVVMMAPISSGHQDVAGFLISIVREFAGCHGLGKVLYEPFQMKTGPDLPGRSPDLLFVANENLARLRPTYLDGPADLALEVVSPDSRTRDMDEKFREYQEGGVREYWIIDPDRQQAAFYVLGEDRVYREAPVEGGIFRSTVLQPLWIRVAWFWQTPLPTVSAVLREWEAG